MANVLDYALEVRQMSGTGVARVQMCIWVFVCSPAFVYANVCKNACVCSFLSFYMCVSFARLVGQ